MRILSLFSALFFLAVCPAEAQNQMPIPATLEGAEIILTLQEGTTEFYPGIVTNTMGVNGPLLGPTLILHADSAVSLIVDNQLSDSTTIHWHGMHVAPEHDGGPHSVIPSGTQWNPQFTVLDKAGINWYHPHLHMRTDEHVSKGIAGLILVRDEEEASLGLPLDYGVDEFPIVLQTKGLDGSGQIQVHTEIDSMVLVNGVVDAFTDFPAQVVRLRVLNGSTQRVMEFGFSDNRAFDLIGTDGGLLAEPVSLTRYRISPGQRADILLDLTGDEGQNFQLMSFGSELPNAVYGSSQPGMGPGLTGTLPGYTSNPLNGSDYSFLDITVGSVTPSPVTSIPTTLASFSPLVEADADETRNLTFNMMTPGSLAGPFTINGALFDMQTINYTIPLGNTEIWSITNQTPIAHPFHIHDVQFFILDINGAPPPPELQGYNDVVLVPGGMGNVRFIAQFSDFANDSIPYMYHCHMLTHEDMGMMGQFLVVETPQVVSDQTIERHLNIYPNPTETGKFFIETDIELDKMPNSLQVTSIDGRTVKNISVSRSGNRFEIGIERAGLYLIQMLEGESAMRGKVIVN